MKYIIWASLAGAFIPVMAVLNARLGAALGESLHAPFILFCVGLLVTSISALALAGSLPSIGQLSKTPALNLVGGVIVAFYVISATLLAPRIGVSNFIVFAVSSQILMSIAIDHFGWFGVQIRPADSIKLIGAGLLISGLVITQFSKGPT
jgi:bacterial/archaeal transporter family-2 protein